MATVESVMAKHDADEFCGPRELLGICRRMAACIVELDGKLEAAETTNARLRAACESCVEGLKWIAGRTWEAENLAVHGGKTTLLIDVTGKARQLVEQLEALAEVAG